MQRHYPHLPFERFADDAICHRVSKAQARELRTALARRFADCALELHPHKTKIIFYKDDDRRRTYPEEHFDFLGYTFRPRRSKNRWGKYFINFSPGVSNAAAKVIRRAIRQWQLRCRVDKQLDDLARMFNPIIRGWLTYDTGYYKSALYRPSGTLTGNWRGGRWRNTNVCGGISGRQSNGCGVSHGVSRACSRTGASCMWGLNDKSRMSREVHVRICERVGVRFPGATQRLLGFAGPKHEAKEIKSRIRAVLRAELTLELSESKTLITHATSQTARFLGYEVRVQQADDKFDRRSQRAVNAAIGLFVPKPVIRQRRARYISEGKPAPHIALLHDDDFTIVAKYQAEYRGLVQDYLLAQDVFHLCKLHWVMETSLLKTLASKHRSTVMKMARRYKATIETAEGPRACLQVTVERDGGRKPLVARFGGIPLRRQRTAVLTDISPAMASTRRNELIHRLLTECCEVCDAQVHLEVHRVR
jgi:hypothetical protein